ncbi:hypothetical protein, partial [Phocaeicola vulgatus]|uniref:hypothetical protein n=1 Tax=Phocaeicola vulgatus TaxID=821 RepID=UPI001C24BFB1
KWDILNYIKMRCVNLQGTHTAMRTFTVFLIFLIPPCMPTIQTKAIPLCITLEIMHKAMFIGITLLGL